MTEAQTATGLAKQALARISKGDRPIVAGPFLAEVGFEVLYWIPMLNWFAERYGVGPERLIAISRGGTRGWYANLSSRYADAFDYCTAKQLKSANAERMTRWGTQKQLEPVPFDEDIASRASDDLGLEDPVVLHPSLMYDLFMPFWRRHDSIGLVQKRTRFRLLPRTPAVDDAEAVIAQLPERYLAVRFYSTPPFPQNAETTDFVNRLVGRLAQVTQVVILGADVDVDDHPDFALEAGSDRVRVINASEGRSNLAVQTEVIRRASALFTAFGGFAHLGPFLGTPTVAFNLVPMCENHHDVMVRAMLDLREQSDKTGFALINMHDAELLELAVRTSMAAAAR
jgi:hypothetical protein